MSTSAIAAAIAVEGLQILMGNGASPQVFEPIANISDFTEPITAMTADVTNVSMTWKSYLATLLDMGKVKFKIFWVMTEPSHQDAVDGAVRGLRYVMVNRILADWQVIYPDGEDSEDLFSAYVTGFNVTGKVGGVFEADIELSQSSLFAEPELC